MRRRAGKWAGEWEGGQREEGPDHNSSGYFFRQPELPALPACQAQFEAVRQGRDSDPGPTNSSHRAYNQEVAVSTEVTTRGSGTRLGAVFLPREGGRAAVRRRRESPRKVVLKGTLDR